MKSTLWTLALWTILLCAAPAYPAQETQPEDRFIYSIHIASYENVQNAREKVLSLGQEGILVFWKKVEAPGETSPYRIYFGQYPTEEEAIAAWSRLQKIGLVQHFGIHLLRKPDVATLFSDKKKKKILPEPPPPKVAARPAWTGSRFVDNGDGTVTDRLNQLMWVKNGWLPEFFAATNWWDAMERLKTFRFNGYQDWRLPTVGEWASLVDRNRQAPAIVEPSPFRNIITHLPYWSKTEYTFGMDFSVKNTVPFQAYTILMYSGNVFHQNKTELAFILPVRSLEPEADIDRNGKSQ